MMQLAAKSEEPIEFEEECHLFASKPRRFKGIVARENMKRFSLLYIGALTAALVSMAPTISRADENDKKTVVKISERTEVPGIILEPGTYVIKLLNSSSNRHIAEILNERMDHLYALTFTAAAERIDVRGNEPILTFYEATSGRPQALRKWFWPSDTIGQEFLYPKDQAARIAAATKQRVPEGNLPTVAESGQSLTPDNSKPQVLESREEAKPVEQPVQRAAVETPVVSSPAQSERTAPPTVIAQNTPPPQRPVDVQPAPTPAVNDSPATLPAHNSKSERRRTRE